MNTNRIESQNPGPVHKPVMLEEMLAHLAPASGEVYVDGTFGAGGYSRAILEAAECVVVAIDRDPAARELAVEFQDKYGKRFTFIPGCFGDVEALLSSAGYEKVDGFVLDIGVSSMQIGDPERGFSFRHNGPLDMRMDNESGQSAYDIVNSYPERALADLIYRFGQERKSRQIAKAIILKRADKPIKTTGQLADIVRSVVPKSPKDKNDPATRTFQALRIAVNDELKELEKALAASEKILKSRGRLVVVTFHSLEDYIVKDFMKKSSGRANGVSRYLPAQDKQTVRSFELLTKKPVPCSSEEAALNPRARSAKLRAAVRTEEVL